MNDLDYIERFTQNILNRNLSFEAFLGELSADLVNLPLESINTAIESSVKKLVKFFEVDRCHLGEFSKDHSRIIVLYFYSRQGKNRSFIYRKALN